MPRGAPDWGFLAPQKNFMQLCREHNHFYERAPLAAQGAGTWSELQLWNPADSGVDAFINLMGFKAQAATLMPVYWYAAARGNLKAHGVNRRAGGVASQIHTRWVSRGIASWAYEIFGMYATTTWIEIDHLNLWLIPGWGLNVLNTTPNNSLEVGFTWFEFLSVEV